MSADTIDAALCNRYIIFLDVDGVLLPVPRFTFGGGDLDGDCARRLARLLAALDGPATIILSSTWRNFPDQVARLDAFLQREAGGGAVPRVAGGTPNGTVLVTAVDYYANDPTEQRLVRDRVDEIQRWLRTHVATDPAGAGGRWFAIDDMKLDVDARMAGHFLHTATDTGLTDERVDWALTELVPALPSADAARAAAAALLVDPALKDEEIAILEVLRGRAEARAAELEAALAASEARAAELSQRLQQQEREGRERERQMEDMRYRLAVVEFTKKNATVREAVARAAGKSGRERKELDDRVRELVTLLMQKKELEKKLSKKRREEARSAVDKEDN